MQNLRVNFTIPEDVVISLKAQVSERKRSAFVGDAIRDKLKELEKELLRQTLAEGYLARRDEDININREWEQATVEGWR
jgi:metal-responsive CopG/Arc/MetJ family transcriptional regulator